MLGNKRISFTCDETTSEHYIKSLVLNQISHINKKIFEKCRYIFNPLQLYEKHRTKIG